MLAWTLYHVVYFVRFHTSMGGPCPNAEAIQGPFPMRPIDAERYEIQRSFGFDFAAVNSNVITGDVTIHSMLLEAIRCLLLLEATTTRNPFLEMGLALFAFIGSMYYEMPPLYRPRIIREG